MSSLYPSLQQMARQYSNVFSPSLTIMIFTVYVQRLYQLYSTTLERTPSLHHIYYPYLVSTPYLLPMHSQNTISRTHVQSVHHFSYPCPISTQSLLPITSDNPTSFFPYKVNTSSLLSLSSHNATYGSLPISSQNTICPTLVPMYSQYTTYSTRVPRQYPISTAHIQSVRHLYKQFPYSTPLYSAHVQRLCHLSSTTPNRMTEPHPCSTTTPHV